ncbi:MAG: TIR domain-containing protein [Bacteroidota bacterium]
MISYQGKALHSPLIKTPVTCLTICEWELPLDGDHSLYTENPEVCPLVSYSREAPFDLFLSFCEEDIEIAEAFYHALTDHGLTVWFSRKRMRIGDNIIAVIAKAIQHSSSALLLLSEHTFAERNHFPLLELNSLMNRMLYDGMPLFPIYHDIDHDYVRQKNILLSDIFARHSTESVADIAEEIASTIKQDETSR